MSAHLVLKMVNHVYPRSRVFVFARGESERRLPANSGLPGAGDTKERSPEKLRAIIDTTPAWGPVIEALGISNPEAGSS